MSKKTLALIIFLFLITVTLLYFAIKTPPPTPQTIKPTPTPLSVNAHTLLSMTQVSATQSSARYTVAVTIDTGDNKVNSVQLELAYDPQALTQVAITPGTFFTQPNILLNTINTTDGRISYALTEQINLPGKKGNGTLALISFSVAPTFTGSATTLSFLPKTAVAADKVMESVLKGAKNYTLQLTKPVSPRATSSAK